jgi:hypothetical protein
MYSPDISNPAKSALNCRKSIKLASQAVSYLFIFPTKHQQNPTLYLSQTFPSTKPVYLFIKA